MNLSALEFFLCGHHLFVFSANVDRQHRQDLLHSNLLAQLVSDKKYPARSGQWQADYGQNLANLGWALLSSQHRSAQPESNRPLSLEQTISQELLGSVPSAEAVAGEALLAALSQPSTFSAAVDARILLRDVADAPPSSLPVAVIEEQEPEQEQSVIESTTERTLNRLSLNLIMVTRPDSLQALSVDFDTFERPSKALLQHKFQPSQTRSNVQVRHGVFNLSSRYEGLRAEVDAKVGQKIHELIMPFN